MKYFLIIFFILLSTYVFAITSTSSGGNWADTLTWVGHQIPGVNDNVTINGPVYLTDTKTVSSLSINNGGGIRNGSSYFGTIKVMGNFTNNGYIENHPTNYYLSLYTYGDVTNNGTFAVRTHYIEGAGSRKYYCSSLHPLQASSEHRVNAIVDTIFAESDLHFASGKITGVSGNAEIMLTSPTNGSHHNLHLDGTNLQSTTIYGASTNSVYITVNEMSSAIIHNVNIYGETNMVNSEFHNVVNYGTLQNKSSYYYNLDLYGDITNYGVIRNNPSGYTLTVNNYGNFYNYGTVTPGRFDFFGDTAQTIDFDSGHPMSAAIVIDQVASSPLISNNDLYFENNSYIDFNYAQLDITDPNADLYLVNSEFRDADIQSTISTEIHSDDDTKLYNSAFTSATLYGVLNFNALTHFNGDIINNGVIQNKDYSYDLHFHGDLENNGVILNNPSGYLLNIYFYGDLVNNGEIKNYRLYAAGTENQNLTSSQNSIWNVDYFYDNVDSSDVVLQSDLYLDHTLMDLNYTDMLFNGYKLTCNGGQLRDLQIVGGNGSTLRMDSLAFVQTMTADDLITEGTTLVASSVTINNLINNGILYNYNSNSYVLVVNGEIENNGTIGSNPVGYSLTLDHHGDLSNYGVFNPYTYNLRGTTDQEIFSNIGTTLEPYYVHDRVSASAVIMNSDLIFDNTYIDLNYAELDMSNSGGNGFTLSLLNGYCRDINIDGNTGSKLFSDGTGYFINMTADTLVTDGTIEFSSGVSVDKLTNDGILQNQGSNSQEFIVYDELINNGTIRSNPQGYLFSISLRGNLTNHGVMNAYHCYLNSTTDQHIFDDGSISVNYITDQNGASKVILDSDVTLTGAYIDLNWNELVLVSSLDNNPVNLTLDGNYMKEAVINGTTGSTLTCFNGNYIYSITADTLDFTGNTLIHSGVTIGELINHGTLTNGTNGGYTLEVDGNITNYGTISTSASGYSLTINLDGNIYNEGVMNFHALHLNGDDQHLNFNTDTYDITLAYFTKNGTGGVYFDSNLQVTGAATDFNNHDIYLYNGTAPKLYKLSGGYFKETTVRTIDGSSVEMENNAYATTVTFEDIDLYGTIEVRSGVTFNKVDNHGTLGAYYAELIVNGPMMNYGILDHSTYSYNMKCYSDFTNLGTIDINNLEFRGMGDVHINFDGIQNIVSTTIFSGAGNVQWNKDNVYTGTYDDALVIYPNNPTYAGFYQAGTGRKLYITKDLRETGIQNIQISAANGDVQLTWDEIPGVLTYNIYESDSDGAAQSLLTSVDDINIGNGTVSTQFADVDNNKFYIIKATN